MYIRLHSVKDNSVIVVDANEILTITTAEGNRSRIVLKELQVGSFYVNESPDKIFNVIEKR